MSELNKWDELEKLAKAATQGEWESRNRLPSYEFSDVVLWHDTSKGGVHKRRLDESGSGHFTKQDAAYIAAANPATILKLLAENKRLAEHLETTKYDLGCFQEQLKEEQKRLDWALSHRAEWYPVNHFSWHVRGEKLGRFTLTTNPRAAIDAILEGK